MPRRRDPLTNRLLMPGVHPVVSPRTGEVTYRARASWLIGSERQHASQTFKSAAAAEEWLSKLHTDIRRGQALEPSSVTVADYHAQWAGRMARQWSGSRARTVRMVWERHAGPYFGTMRIQAVTRPVVQRFVDTLVADGRKPGTIRTYMAGIVAMFGDAVRDGLIDRNPASDLTYPRAAPAQKPVWSPLQLRTFVARTADDPLGSLWAFLVATGCRIGEALALHWQDIDFANGTVRIHRTLSRGEDGVYRVREGTKTSDRGRTVPLDTWAVRVLDALPRTHDLVWHVSGEPLPISTVRWRWGETVEATGMPPLTLHGVRHSYISALIMAGVNPRTVADLVGHASTEMTMEVYSHSSAADLRHAVRTFGELVGERERDAG